MPEPSIGPVVNAGALVETRTRDTLRNWMPWYLARVDASESLTPGATRPPRTWDVASDDSEGWLTGNTPALVVLSPGTDRPPERHGRDGTWGEWNQVNVGCRVAGATTKGARGKAHRHAAAIMLTVLQQLPGGQIAAVEYLGRERAHVGCEVLFSVHVPKIAATRVSVPTQPPTDPTDPPAPFPDVVASRYVVTPEPPAIGGPDRS